MSTVDETGPSQEFDTSSECDPSKDANCDTSQETLEEVASTPAIDTDGVRQTLSYYQKAEEQGKVVTERAVWVVPTAVTLLIILAILTFFLIYFCCRKYFFGNWHINNKVTTQDLDQINSTPLKTIPANQPAVDGSTKSGRRKSSYGRQLGPAKNSRRVLRHSKPGPPRPNASQLDKSSITSDMLKPSDPKKEVLLFKAHSFTE